MILGENVTTRASKMFETLEQRFREKHGDKYDYSKVVFTNMSTKVTIICPIHGAFQQKPKVHLHRDGHGCPKCGQAFVGMKNRLSVEDFISRAKIIHNNRYDYSKVEDFNSTYDKVIIICPTHGEFLQSVDNHLRKRNCPKCQNRKTQEQYLAKAKEIHKDRYDYSKLIYTGVKDKVEIICKVHGSFFQRADTHLSGCGCPHCSATLPPTEKHKETPTTFYVIKYKGLYKIGITLKKVKQRYRRDVEDINDIEILTEIIIDGYDKAFMFEQFLMNKYFQYRYFGKKIFKNTGITEVFTENIYEMYLNEEM